MQISRESKGYPRKEHLFSIEDEHHKKESGDLIGSISFDQDSLTSDSDFEFESPIGVPLSLTLSKEDIELDKTISLLSGIGIIVGATIGSGIFASPGPVLDYTHSVGTSLVIWVVAGLLSMIGGICYAGNDVFCLDLSC